MRKVCEDTDPGNLVSLGMIKKCFLSIALKTDLCMQLQHVRNIRTYKLMCPLNV